VSAFGIGWLAVPDPLGDVVVVVTRHDPANRRVLWLLTAHGPFPFLTFCVMAGLVPVSRVYPTYGNFVARNSGKPELRCHPRLASRMKDVDARAGKFTQAAQAWLRAGA